MVASGEAILRFAKGGRARFMSDAMVRRAIEREFEIMGEAARRLSQEFRDASPQVPWRTMIGFRDYLIHGYDSVVPEKVWAAVTGSLKTTLPELRKFLGPS